MVDPDRIHVVMRFADGFLSAEDTIARHREVLEKHDAVWIGKLGKRLGEKWIKIANEQVSEGSTTYLFLVQKEGTEYVAHRCRVLQMSTSVPPDEENLIPKYYEENGIRRQVSFWIKLGSLTKVKKGGFPTANSATDLSDAFFRSFDICFPPLSLLGL